MFASKAALLIRPTLFFAAMLTASGCATHSRNPTQVTIYHGKGNSQAVAYEVGAGGRSLTSQRQLELDLPEGSRVCLTVLNAHTPFFNYAFRTTTDSSIAPPPSFGNVLTVLDAAVASAPAGAAGVSGAGVAGFRAHGLGTLTILPRNGSASEIARAADLTQAYRIFRDNVNTLQSDVDQVRTAIIYSVLPEELRPVEMRVETTGRRGLAHAQDTIAMKSEAPGRFNDPKLGEAIATWRADALEAAGGRAAAETDIELINALHARAITLLAARDAIRSTYGPTQRTWQDCRALPRGKTTIHLAAQPREASQYTGQRDTGSIVQVVATSDYRRDVVEIVPLAFLAFPRNVTGFGIVNDKVVEDRKYAEEAVFRIGTMLTTSPWRFGPASEWAVGPGIGTGIIGGDKPALTDFFLGGLISWRDWIRMGGGYGFSQAPARLNNGAQVGQPLPLGDGRESLNDFIERKRVGTWFLTFTLTGLKLNP